MQPGETCPYHFGLHRHTSARALLYDRLSGPLYRAPTKLYGHNVRLNGVSLLITSANSSPSRAISPGVRGTLQLDAA